MIAFLDPCRCGHLIFAHISLRGNCHTCTPKKGTKTPHCFKFQTIQQVKQRKHDYNKKWHLRHRGNYA